MTALYTPLTHVCCVIVRSFKAALVGVLRATVVLPGEYIVVLGDVGTEMYIVRSGDVRVVDSSGMVLHMLSSGSFFGEVRDTNPPCLPAPSSPLTHSPTPSRTPGSALVPRARCPQHPRSLPL